MTIFVLVLTLFYPNNDSDMAMFLAANSYKTSANCNKAKTELIKELSDSAKITGRHYLIRCIENEIK